MPIISVNIDEDLLKRVDEATVKLGYRSRSELVRAALQSFLAQSEEPVDTPKLILVLSSHKEHKGVDKSIVETVYRHLDSVDALYHQLLDKDNCLTIIIARGPGIRPLLRSLRGIRGVTQVSTLPLAAGDKQK